MADAKRLSGRNLLFLPPLHVCKGYWPSQAAPMGRIVCWTASEDHRPCSFQCYAQSTGAAVNRNTECKYLTKSSQRDTPLHSTWFHLGCCQKFTRGTWLCCLVQGWEVCSITAVHAVEQEEVRALTICQPCSCALGQLLLNKQERSSIYLFL